METFIDRIENNICKSRSILVAGIDPDIESIPEIFWLDAQKRSTSPEDVIAELISDFYITVLSDQYHRLAAIKPNLAFFEQFSIGGLRAYKKITRWASDPFSLGSYSYNKLGSNPNMRHELQKNLDNLVFFAGEATNPDYFGTVHGAYLSGLRVAGEVLKS